MAEHKTVDVDPQDLKNAQNMWHNFTVGGTYAVIVTCIVLVGLALAFVKLV